MNFYGSPVGLSLPNSCVTTVHDRYYYWEKALRCMAMRFVAKHIRIATGSRELTEFLVEKVGIPADNLKIIYNGIDLKQYNQSNETGSRLGPPDLE